MSERRLIHARIALRYATLAQEAAGPKVQASAKPGVRPSSSQRPLKVQRVSTRQAGDRPSRPMSGIELQARAAERARWAEVMASPEAAGRVALAASLLADSDASADKIRAILQTSPVTSVADAARYTAAQFVQVQRKVTGEYAPPLQGEAAKIVNAYHRAIGAT